MRPIGTVYARMGGKSVHKEVEKGFWSVDELCQYLNIKKSTAYALAQSGSIRFYRIGRLIRFKPDDVQAWVEGRRSDNVDEDKACRTKLAVEVKGDINKLLNYWDQWSWHRVTFYGDLKKPVYNIAALMGFEVVEEA